MVRGQDQTAPSPATRRREMLDAVVVVVERMQTLALDDQTFVGCVPHTGPSTTAGRDTHRHHTRPTRLMCESVDWGVRTLNRAMAEHLELSPRTLRVAVAKRQAEGDAAATAADTAAAGVGT
jgi:hypothetical protein